MKITITSPHAYNSPSAECIQKKMIVLLLSLIFMKQKRISHDCISSKNNTPLESLTILLSSVAATWTQQFCEVLSSLKEVTNLLNQLLVIIKGHKEMNKKRSPGPTHQEI